MIMINGIVIVQQKIGAAIFQLVDGGIIAVITYILMYFIIMNTGLVSMEDRGTVSPS